LYLLVPLAGGVMFAITPAGKNALRKLGNRLTRIGLAKEERILADSREKAAIEARMSAAHLRELPEEIKRQEEIRAIEHEQVMLIHTIRKETFEHERELLTKAYESKLDGGDFTPLQPEMVALALPAPKSQKELEWEASQRSYTAMQAAGLANMSSAALGQYQPAASDEGRVLVNPFLDQVLRKTGSRMKRSFSSPTTYSTYG
jgi:hypothetical protein